MTQYIFLYGTLLPSHAPAQIAPTVSRLRSVGRGQSQGWLYDLGRYPGAVFRKEGPPIHGEVFELPDDPEALRQLDAYEEFDPQLPDSSEFVRQDWPVMMEDGRKITCWVYVYNRDPGAAPRIVGGDFAKLRSSIR